MLVSAPEYIRRHLEESARVKLSSIDLCAMQIEKTVDIVAETFLGRGRLFLCGNGGSAADAQHIAAEFVSVLTQDFVRPGLAAIALTTDSSFLTACANDFGFEAVFGRQVAALGRPGDTLLGISTSGRSANVRRAFAIARELGLRTVLMSGESGSSLAGEVDVVIAVPSGTTQYIQEAHITIGHIICALAERRLFNAGSLPGTYLEVGS